MALGRADGCLGPDVDRLAARQCAVAAISGDGPRAWRRARQALLARRGRGRSAVDAAAGHWPPERRWPRAGCRGRAHLEPDLVRMRRTRNSLSALASAAGWTALRRLRAV